MTAPRFELVRTDAGWHARFKAANSRIIWTTEVLTRQRYAERAVELITGATIHVSPFTEHPEVEWNGEVVEVRDVDLRGAA